MPEAEARFSGSTGGDRMKYYYTEVVQDAETGAYQPAKDDNATLVSAMADLVGGVDALKLDKEIPANGRYVLACPDDQPAQAGWDEKTAEEVNIDYPGLVPVGG